MLGGEAILSLYNGLVLPHLQYCLMVWGDFKEGRNLTLGGSLLRYQKRFAGLMAGVGSRYHADPLFARFSMLKIGDLYRQQLRVHAWRFWNGRLPAGLASMLQRVGDVHGHNTRAARGGMHVGTRDHRSIGYRVPVEWAGMTGELREAGSLAAFKRRSRAGFLGEYELFVCTMRECVVCAEADA